MVMRVTFGGPGGVISSSQDFDVQVSHTDATFLKIHHMG
jgi:hypothetical protein